MADSACIIEEIEHLVVDGVHLKTSEPEWCATIAGVARNDLGRTDISSHALFSNIHFVTRPVGSAVVDLFTRALAVNTHVAAIHLIDFDVDPDVAERFLVEIATPRQGRPAFKNVAFRLLTGFTYTACKNTLVFMLDAVFGRVACAHRMGIMMFDDDDKEWVALNYGGSAYAGIFPSDGLHSLSLDKKGLEILDEVACNSFEAHECFYWVHRIYSSTSFVGCFAYSVGNTLRNIACIDGLSRIINKHTPPLGDGQEVGGAGGLVASLPNEVWALVAERVWPERALLELGWTCRLMRSCCLTNYVAYLRYGPGRGDWRQIYREAWMACN